MDRYISVEKFKEYADKPSVFDTTDLKSMIDEQPTADVVEVVHAEWIDRVPYIWSDDHMTMTGNGEGCSVCKWVNKGGVEKYFNYCPNCGAKMDKEREQNG